MCLTACPPGRFDREADIRDLSCHVGWPTGISLRAIEGGSFQWGLRLPKGGERFILRVPVDPVIDS